MDAGAEVVIFAGHVEAAVAAAGGDQDGLCAVLVAGDCFDAVIVVLSLNFGDILGLQQFNAEAFGLGPEPLSEFKAIDTVRETGQVIQFFQWPRPWPPKAARSMIRMCLRLHGPGRGPRFRPAGPPPMMITG